MSTERTTAYWYKEFADKINQDTTNWYLEYEILLEPPEECWDSPSNPYELVSMALTDPSRIRRAVPRIKISGPAGTYSYPVPMQEAPPVGTRYWAPARGSWELVFHYEWSDTAGDYNRLRRGICHADRNSAYKHAEAEIRAAGFEP